MSARGPTWVLLGLLAATVAGFGFLFAVRLNHGDSFPYYSSLRLDPLGTRVLHDSLAEIPGLRVGRRFDPLAGLDAVPPRTLILAGFDQTRWTAFPEAEFRALDRAIRGGSRVIIALRAVRDDEARAKKKAEAKKKETAGEKAGNPEKNGTGDTVDRKHAKPPGAKKTSVPPPIDLGAQWAVATGTRRLVNEAKRTDAAPSNFALSLHWGSEVFFRPEAKAPWKVLYRRGGEPVFIERTLGRGSLVLLGDSYLLSNEAMQRDRAPVVLAWLLGTEKAIEFDESHLGVIEDRGVAALARSYGLTGAFGAFLVAAGLFVWQRMALFVPPAAEAEEVALSYNQTAGLEALMRRALTPAELAAACLAEWRRTARPADVARAQAAVAACAPDAPAATIYNAVVRALRRR